MSTVDVDGKLIENLQEKINRYVSRTYKDEDQFQVSTAVILDHLMEMGELGWFHANQNLYRRGLTALRSYIPKRYKNKLERLARRLGAKGKRMGIKAGVSDCIIYSHRLALELKIPGGSQSGEQKRWSMLIKRWGWVYEVCKTPESVLDALERSGILTKEVIGRG